MREMGESFQSKACSAIKHTFGESPLDNIHLTTASALSASPQLANAFMRAVHETTSGSIPEAVISSKSATALIQSPPAAHALITAA